MRHATNQQPDTTAINPAFATERALKGEINIAASCLFRYKLSGFFFSRLLQKTGVDGS
jgi:hypothetical protein